MAEFYMKNLVRQAGLADRVFVASAATSDEQIGCDTDERTKRKLRAMGIPYTKRSAWQLSRGDYAKYDYIIGFDNRNIAAIRRITGGDPDGKIYKLLEFAGFEQETADPWYTLDFDATYRDVETGCKALLQRLKASEESFLD